MTKVDEQYSSDFCSSCCCIIHFTPAMYFRLCSVLMQRSYSLSNRWELYPLQIMHGLLKEKGKKRERVGLSLLLASSGRRWGLNGRRDWHIHSHCYLCSLEVKVMAAAATHGCWVLPLRSCQENRGQGGRHWTVEGFKGHSLTPANTDWLLAMHFAFLGHYCRYRCIS